MRGVDLYRRSPLRRGREVAASAALFAVSPIAIGPRESPSPVPASEERGYPQPPRPPGAQSPAAAGESGLTWRPQNPSLENRITEQN